MSPHKVTEIDADGLKVKIAIGENPMMEYLTGNTNGMPER